MPGSTYSTNLKVELMATGENSGTWGDITNTNLGTALEQAIVGYGNPDYASDANLTISITNSNAAQAARALVLNVTSSLSLTATRELVVPTIQKQYIVQNNTTGSQSITVKTSAGTGITVPNGRKAHLYVNGTDVIQMFDFVDINGGAIDGTPVGASSASTGAFTTLNASGATTLDGNVTLGNASGDNVTVTGTITSNLLFTDNTYDIGASGATRPRNLFLAGAATIGGNLSVGGTLTLTGGVNLNGNVTVGDNTTDTLTINSTITSNLIFTDNTYDIGASGATRPRNLFLAGSATIGGNQTLTGSLTVDSTTDSSSTTTGSIQTDGGLGVAKNAVLGGALTTQSSSAVQWLMQYGGNAARSAIVGSNSGVSTNYNAVYIQANTNADGSQSNTGLSSWALALGNDDATASGDRATVSYRSAGGSWAKYAYWFSDGTLTNNYGAVFNESGADSDFRVEGDTDTHALFVDASSNNIGLGASTPLTKLDARIPDAFSTVVSDTSLNNNTSTVARFSFLTDPGATITAGTGVAIALSSVPNRGEVFLVATNASTSKDASDFAIWTTGGAVASERFRVTNSGSLYSYLAVGAEVVFNESGVDADFRVESDAQTHMFFVDAGNSRIGVNQSAPETQLHIGNTSTTTSQMTLAGEYQSSGYTNSNIFNFQHGGNVRARMRSQQVSAASDNFILDFDMVNGSVSAFNNFLRLRGTASDTGGEVVVNDGGLAEIDFRVESDNNSAMLFVDAGNDRVVIGGTTPAANSTLTVYQYGTSGSPGGNNAQIMIDANANSGSGQAALKLLAGSGTTNRAARIDFLNGVNSTTTPQWTFLNDYQQDGTNDFNLIRGTADQRAVFYSGSTVFNETGNDVDFRVESDTSTHALFVDAGGNWVAINSNANFAGSRLYVEGDITVNYNQTIGMRYNVSGSTNSYYKGMSGTNPSGASARGLHLFNYDQDSDPGIQFWSGVPGGTVYNMAIFGPGATGSVVFNEEGRDRDFRVESVNSTAMLFVDASVDRVGIKKATLTGGAGNTTIEGILQIGSSDNTTSLSITTAGSDYAGLRVKNGGTNVGGGADWWDITVRPSYASGVASGADQEMIRFATPYAGQVAVVINEGSNDVDFRVESDGNTHCLFVDGGSNKVGINSSGPRTPLEVRDQNSNITTFSFGGQFQRGTSDTTVNLLTLSNYSNNCTVGIYIRMVAASPVTNDAAVIEAWAAASRQSGGAVTRTAVTPVVAKAIVGTNINAGTLAWSGDTLQYTTNSSTNYTGYGLEFQVTAFDSATVTFLP